MTATYSSAPTGVVGIGYEGRSAADLVEALAVMGVALVVDVRLNPISRKAGLSKNALAHRLGEWGIAYQHRPALGNPKSNRPGFAGGSEQLAEARSAFGTLLERAEARHALDELAAVAESQLVALLCYEADQRRCHRDLVLEALTTRSATAAAGSTRLAR